MSPIAAIEWGLGPMKTRPSSSSRRQNSSFSERKPYPGWTASAPVCLQAAMILSIARYDSFEGGGPMQTLSSASSTCRAFLSASEYTATVRIPILRAVLMTRHAISPRLAIRIF